MQALESSGRIIFLYGGHHPLAVLAQVRE